MLALLQTTPAPSSTSSPLLQPPPPPHTQHLASQFPYPVLNKLPFPAGFLAFVGAGLSIVLTSFELGRFVKHSLLGARPAPKLQAQQHQEQQQQQQAAQQQRQRRRKGE